MALYIPHSIFHFARLLYVRPETFRPYYVSMVKKKETPTLLDQLLGAYLLSLDDKMSSTNVYEF